MSTIDLARECVQNERSKQHNCIGHFFLKSDTAMNISKLPKKNQVTLYAKADYKQNS